jgi:DNA modification methylase
VAGLKLKRKVLGFEIKEEYCHIAKKRVKDFGYFGTKPRRGAVEIYNHS